MPVDVARQYGQVEGRSEIARARLALEISGFGEAVRVIRVGQAHHRLTALCGDGENRVSTYALLAEIEHHDRFRSAIFKRQPATLAVLAQQRFGRHHASFPAGNSYGGDIVRRRCQHMGFRLLQPCFIRRSGGSCQHRHRGKRHRPCSCDLCFQNVPHRSEHVGVLSSSFHDNGINARLGVNDKQYHLRPRPVPIHQVRCEHRIHLIGGHSGPP